MSNNMQKEIAVIENAPAAPAGLALASMSPAQFVAETYAPFLTTMAAHIAEAEAVKLDITTPAGMKEAIRWRALFRDEYRLPIEAKRKAAKAPLLEAGKLIDSRAAELVEMVHPVEVHFHEQIKAEEQRKEAERAAAIEANRLRVAALQKRLADIGAVVVVAAGMDSAGVLAERDRLAANVPGEDWEDHQERATTAHREALAALEELYKSKLAGEEQARAEAAAREAERQRIAAEQAELARQRAAQEAAAQQMAEQRAAFEREQATARRREQEAAAESQRQADAMAAELKRQQDELAAARAEVEAERNRIAAAQRAAEELAKDHAEALDLHVRFYAVELPSGQRYSGSTFKDNGEPILLTAEGKRSVFCDLTDDMEESPIATQEEAEAVYETAIATEEAQAPAEMLDLPEAEPTDVEIIEVYCAAFGGSAEDAMARLVRFAMDHAG